MGRKIIVPSDFVLEGNTFTLSRTDTLSAGETKYIGIEPQKEVYLMRTDLSSNSEGVKLIVYEGSEFSGGALETLINSNRVLANAATTNIHYEVNQTNVGTKLREYIAFANKGGGNSANVSSGLAGDEILILNKNKKYMIAIQNTGTSATNISVFISLVES